MLYKLIDIIDENCNNVDKDFIIKAYNFAYNAHKNQKRESGELYIVHPIEVACILAEMGMDTDTITAGLLHDVIEDTEFTYDDIKNEFNQEVANLVEGVTKLGKIKYKTKEEVQADNVRKMLLAMTKDIRVILIKLADRLHNMRTLKYMSIEKQKQKSNETMDIYAPLAHRLGISRIKWELEDLAFRYLNPEQYYDLVRKVAEKRVEREANISSIMKELQDRLDKANIKCEIDGRPKHFYSIYRKMVNKNKTIDQIYDLTAIRIFVNNVKDCYAALGVAHTMYKPMPGRFKDYIAMPKPNMYQSLHSTVIAPEGKPFEIQIRTFEMHKTAEYGIAAHWKYKAGIKSTEMTSFDNKLSWLHDVIEWQKETSDAEEFMKNFKIDMFADEVFVFTPNGNVINLPHHSTPIDFAYRIHTDVGNSCIGAKVNGKMIPLDYKLKTGEIVEIITASVPKGPTIEWLQIAKSNVAKSKIRAWFKKASKEDNIVKGKDILERDSKRQEYNFGEIAKGEALDELLKRYNLKSLDDIYAAVGMGGIVPSTVITRLKEYGIKNKEASLESKEVEDEINKALSKSGKKSRSNNDMGVIVKGETNVLVRFSKCCNPVAGDEIIGYITKGRGVSIHRKDCKNLNGLFVNDENRMIEVSWGNAKISGYIAQIEVKAENRDGILMDVMEVINSNKIHLLAINANTVKLNEIVIDIKVRVEDLAHLKDFMRQIKRVKGIIEIFRTKS